ncbi:SDR family NAD(P)-dependent oxidoreductase [Brevibacillus laterosporus]|uniref:SDR family NAD(P)-dependent oxidoreductase n=1 Tax=Brevibacillus laterosporus TaxID=1465 RepID=UPI0003B23083|nr:SDR family NAD(P)-dependent oxidoreductase [Brevibacillus laterosporus]ERM17719.1 hypothetical protein P615_19110 [Brevibacillus laterosporus PE36]
MNRREEDVYSSLRESMAHELSVDVELIQTDVPFIEMGMDSIIGVSWIRKINSNFNLSIPATKIYAYPTLGEFHQYLLSILGDSTVERVDHVEDKLTTNVRQDVQHVNSNEGPTKQIDEAAPDVSGAALFDVVSELKGALAAELDLNTSFIDEDTPFTELGLDSIIGVTWIRKINSRFKLSLPVTKVYSYPTISKFAEYLIQEHGEILCDVSTQEVENPKSAIIQSEITDPVLSQVNASAISVHDVGPKQALATEQVAASITPLERISAKAPASDQTGSKTEGESAITCDIAIVGMSGSFPQAQNLDEFWNNILEGKDCISEVPTWRWKADEFYDPKPDIPGKTYSKWMGVLENADKFDPLFFNISPIEAEQMDPQQRLMLQESWRCIEDAGYDPFTLSGSKCGVYIGCSPSGYGGNLELTDLNAHQNLGNNMAVLASRISYFLNLRGPCLSIDTACSSSLVAIASACDNLLLGNIDLALSGGVWVIPGPGLHVAMSQLGALSPDGRCFAFESRANGFVPAEGVGVVMLKRLEDAERDRDHIYAVIKGWGINQDGKTNGITAPNAAAQTDLHRSIYQKFNINPENIQLIETHGTGTSLGDPIEVEGLVSAFSEYTDKRHFCALTSVKSNIGHTACAAGVAGLIKTALAIKNKELPPIANFSSLNPHIDFKETPFYVNEKRRHWVQTTGLRQAAVSSFGYSGTNTHIVLAETPYVEVDSPDNPSYLIVLSARDGKQLEAQARNLLSYISQKPDIVIGNISYTLLVGRKHFRNRVAVVVSNLSELSTELMKWLEKDPSSRITTGNATPLPITNTNPDLESFYHSVKVCHMESSEAEYASALSIVAKLYIKGYNLPFMKLFDAKKYRRVSLPTYPFVQQSYWLNHDITTPKQDRVSGEIRMYPVTHSDTSVGDCISFTASLGADDFFMRDHKVGKTMVVPGVVYVEMAREAIQRAMAMLAGTRLRSFSESQIRLQNVIWLQPGALTGNELSLELRVLPKSDDRFEYTIMESGGNEEILYNQGVVRLVPRVTPEILDVEELARIYSERIISSQEFYRIYNDIGLIYGSSHQAVVELRVGQGEDYLPGVLVKLENPRSKEEHNDGFVLHPSIMDGALQATIALGLETSGVTRFDSKARLPFSFDSLDICQPTPNRAYAWIRHSIGGSRNSSVQKLDISICDEQGNICVDIKGFSSREYVASMPNHEDVSFITPIWTPTDLKLSQTYSIPEQDVTHKVVLLGAVNQKLVDNIRKLLPESIELERIQMDDNSLSERYESATQYVTSLIREWAGAGYSRKKLLQVVVVDNETKEYRTLCGISGLLKTASLEYPTIRTQCIGWFDEMDPYIFKDFIYSAAAQEVRDFKYSGNIMYHKKYETLSDHNEIGGAFALREGGTYLITGGIGGLGRIFARFIASNLKRGAVILTGRSTRDHHIEEFLNSLRGTEFRAEYVQCDISDSNSVAKLFDYIETSYCELAGIIHAAGTLNDGYIMKKSRSAIHDVLSPKVAGIVNLDEASKVHRLDFFASFSSNVSELGNPGQSDYAAANGFMDVYSACRADLVVAGQRYGQTLSVNWPLWAEGGMKVDHDTEQQLRSQGLVPLGSREGVEAFQQALLFGRSQLCVFAGNTDRVKNAFEIYSTILLDTRTQDIAAQVATENNGSIPMDKEQLLHHIQTALIEMVTEQLKVQPDDIDIYNELSEYGFDSISFTKFANTINSKYDVGLTPTIFFEYPTLGGISEYLLEEHEALFAKQWRDLLGNEVLDDKFGKEANEKVQNDRTVSKQLSRNRQRVAIIGMSGCFPQADDLEQFWDNLLNGADCITEIPSSRWDWRKLQGDPKSGDGKTNVKWGGFINEVDRFDPLFFGISPREAVSMDPQQRLLMTHAWLALEDSGYAPSSLAGSDTAVLIGTAPSGYGNLLLQARHLGESYASTGISGSVGPNRVSYLLDLHGPSEPIETACSSSLVAIHRGAELIRRGEVSMAIVGGVNTIVSPDLHISYSRAGMLCDDGRCKTFSDKANGYVRGEGVGVLVLKSLELAEADGDHIYGVILASVENHGGRANSLTAPNPNAQAELIKAAYRQADIDPSTVTYIEAHGTGTELGDPIEINALKKAFGEIHEERGSDLSIAPVCGIGSVKSNIGHLELAAGVAGVIKTLLQMKHKTLVKSLHTDTINPYIRLEQSPFYILRENRPWETQKGSNGEINPRRAGVSSFGFGGVNAHLLLEEYTIQESEKKGLDNSRQTAYPIVLSARSEQQLLQIASSLLDFIDVNRLNDQDLASLAFTLQVGRDAMEERLATVVRNMKDLREKLESICADQPNYISWYKGTIKQSAMQLATFNSDKDRQKVVSDWVQRKKYEPILDLWVQGLHFDWMRLHSEGQMPNRMSLPTYPFERQKYWVKGGDTGSHLHESCNVQPESVSQIHPLIHQNISTLHETVFSSHFDGSEFFLADHIVNGHPMLPGVAYLEMAREAIVRAAGAATNIHVALDNVVWLKPAIVTDQPVDLRIRIHSTHNNELSYEIYTLSDGKDVVFCKGNGCLMETSPTIKTRKLDVNQLLTSCSLQRVTGDEIYTAYDNLGLHYGPTYRAVMEVNCGIDNMGNPQAVAKLSCPEAILPTLFEFMLHPSVIDSALQASLGMNISFVSEKQLQRLGVPYAVDFVNIYSESPSEAYAWIRYSEGNAPGNPIRKLDISVFDAEGNVCAELGGLSSREFKERDTDSAPYLLYGPEWVPAPLPSIESVIPSNAHIFLIGDINSDQKSRLEQVLSSNQLMFIPVKDTSSDQQYMDVVQRLFRAIQPLVSVRTITQTLVQVVILNGSENAGASLAGVSGLLKTAALENPNLNIQCVEIDRELEADELIDTIIRNSADPDAKEVHYSGEERLVKRMVELSSIPEVQNSSIWKNEGIYLITGGLGKLGLTFARDIATHAANATIILCGRSPISAEKQLEVDLLNELGVSIVYQCVDISSYEQVKRLVRSIEMTHGTLTGIIHCAGIIKDRYIINKPIEDLESVLMPKVSGTVNLDRATSTHPLDYFICFSSTSAELGNPGQSDYAAANAFMDKYSLYRNQLVREGKRVGHTLSINWPLWTEGGMQVEEGMRKRMAMKGIGTLSTEKGMEAFKNAARAQLDQVLIISSDPDSESKRKQTQKIEASAVPAHLKIPSDSALRETALRYFKKVIADALSMPVERLDIDAQLERYGVDSMMSMDLISHLEKTFGSLSNTLFFEVQTIRDLTDYFIDRHRSVLNSLFGVKENSSIGSVPNLMQEQEKPVLSSKTDEENERPIPSNQVKSTDVAIIGMVGRYPKARNVNEFWNNLVSGTDCVSEIPTERWNLNDFFDSNKDSVGTSYCKWGGFLDDVDQFDPQFFNITPREAKLMDPQQRIFLEAVWELLEGNGITQSKIDVQYDRRVGVYVGSMYQMYQAENTDIVGNALTSISSYNMIANRVSYYFGFEGPSVAVDNMCSSSAMAIHLACNALAQGEAKLAIAGGVNLSIDPKKYIALSQTQLLASSPHSRSFSDGDGYLPSEGVGAVLLKPLSDAIKDGDNIMAVIKSSSSMHGGRSNGFMAPRYKTQVNVIEDCLSRAGLVPDDIEYIEAAANGAALGDAVEINAMAHVFRNTEKVIPIGSVKSNIGHPEAASGIAQLTKVVLQLENNIIPPIMQFGQVNSNLNIENLPFRLTSELETWSEGSQQDQHQSGYSPRRALINSIGAGGSYVSLIIEEYTNRKTNTPADMEINPQLIVLSAKDDEALRRVAENSIHYLEENKEIVLSNLAYTLQFGRNELPVRLAFTARSVDDVVANLTSYLGKSSSKGSHNQTIYTGNVETDFAELELLVTGRRGEEFVHALVSDRDLDKLAAIWVKGCRVDWSSLHDQSQRTIMSFPTYPFKKSRYWHSEGLYSKTLPQQSLAPVEQVKNQAHTGKPDFVAYLIEFFAEYVGVATEQIPVDKDIHSLGIDSLAWIRLQRKVEKDFGIQLLSTELLNFTKVSALADCLEAKLVSQPSNNPIDKDMGEKKFVQVSDSDSVPLESNISEIERKMKMLEDFKNGEVGLEKLKISFRQ